MRLTLGVLAATASVLGAAAQVRPSGPPDEGRISGRVITTSAERVADAAVSLLRVEDNQPPVEVRKTDSDGGGGFSFDQLPPGRYRLSASRPEYTARLGDRTEATIDLRSGAHASAIEIVLYRPASIAGRIIRPDGTPAPDLSISAVELQETTPRVLPGTQTTSQWDGRYTIPNLPPGEFLVAVSMRGTSERTYYPGVSEADRSEPVSVFEGVASEGIDIWLTPAQRFNVSGRVFWPDGAIVDNIAIDYGDPAGTRSGVWYLSDPGGLFTLTGIPPGPLVLFARAESNQGTLVGIASTEVAVDSVEDVRIVIARPGSIEGRIVYEGGAAPSARATTIALVQKLLTVSALHPVPEAPIAADGGFQIWNVRGEFELELRGLGPGLAITRVLRNGVPLPMTRLSVAGGETIDGLQIVVGR